MSLKDSSIMPVLAVDDLDRAISFYRDKLGLEVRRLEGEEESALVDVGGSGGPLLLYRSSFSRGETTAASFLVADIEGIVKELRGRGLSFEEYDLPGLKTEGGIATTGDLKGAWFKDSEGNTIALTTEMTISLEKAA